MLGGRAHGHINILENLAALNAASSVGGFDEVVSDAATLLAAKFVDEEKRLGKLPGFDQKTGAVKVPCRSHRS